MVSAVSLTPAVPRANLPSASLCRFPWLEQPFSSPALPLFSQNYFLTFVCSPCRHRNSHRPHLASPRRGEFLLTALLLPSQYVLKCKLVLLFVLKTPLLAPLLSERKHRWLQWSLKKAIWPAPGLSALANVSCTPAPPLIECMSLLCSSWQYLRYCTPLSVAFFSLPGLFLPFFFFCTRLTSFLLKYHFREIFCHIPSSCSHFLVPCLFPS